MKRMFALTLLLAVIPCVTGCLNEPGSSPPGAQAFRSFRDIPGVTDDEIAAIEALREKYDSFSYGMLPSNEAFTRSDGTIGGYAALFCGWLAELFGIQFVPEHITWNGLLEGLKSGHVDFSGDLTPTEERRQVYFMTDAIAQRWLCYFRLEGARPLAEITRTRPLRYVLVEGSTIAEFILTYVTETYDVIYAAEFEQTYDILKSGQADAIIDENTAETYYDVYGDIVMESFLPLLDSPVSFSTQNPELEPVISVVQKALENGGYQYARMLYDLGYNEYKKHKLWMRLTEEEKAYINDNPVIPFVAEYDNYPLSFYNARSREWQGVCFDVLREAGILTGLEFALVNDEQTEWHDLLLMLETGQALFVTELLRTEGREGRFLWPDTIITSNQPVLMSLSNFDNLSISRVPTVRVGMQRDTGYTELFRTWFPNHSNVIIYESQNAYYDALLNGEVDMIMSSYNSMLYLTNYLERVDVKPNIIFDRTNESTFGFHKDAAVLCSIFDKALGLIDTGIISDQWLHRAYDYRAKVAEVRFRWLIRSIVLIMMVIALAVILFHRNRKEALERAVMRESEERIRLILDAAPICVNLIDKNFQCIVVNDEAVRLYGLNNKQEYIQMFSTGRLSEEKGAPHLQKAFKEGYWRGEMTFLKPHNAEPLPCDLTLIRVKYKDDYVIAAYARDLRGEKAAIKKIRETTEEKHLIEEANRHLRTILDMLPVGIIIVSKRDGILLYANNAVLNIYNGRSFEEDGAGHNFLEFLPEFQPDGRKTFDVILDIWSKKETLAELQCRKLTGELFWVRLAYCDITYNGIPASLNAVEDMTAEKEYQQTLRNAALRELEANQLKSRFLATMSHEIRTPMNAIIGMSELALRESEPEGKNEHIQTVKQAASNLIAIINDILDLSKIEAGKMEIFPVKYSTASLLNDIVSIIRMRVIDSQIRFVVKADSNIPRVLYGDETRIRQAVINILNNAVKYTESGFISFDVNGEFIDSETVNIIFTVTDSGIGIKPEDIGKLFDDFTQFDHEKSRNNEGVGLGLSITKNIVNAMGGNINVRSEYGKGSTFTVTLPQKFHSRETMASIEKPEGIRPGEEWPSVLVYERRDVYAQSLAFTVRNLGADCTLVSSGTDLYQKMENRKYDYLFISLALFEKNEETILKFGQGAKTVIIAVFGEAVPEKHLNVLVMPVYCTQIADLFNGVHENLQYTANNESAIKFCSPHAKVLVVDDINTNLKVMQGLLAPYNMQIDICNNGKDAIEAVRSGHYDLVFMDHKMPGMDGVETAKRIREWERGQLSIINEQSPVPSPQSPVPIIALTANAVSGMKEFFIESGFNDFISKPIDTVQLNAILEKWIPKEKQEKK